MSESRNIETGWDKRPASDRNTIVMHATHEKTPRVSIALPVYNGADFLAETLDSLLGQTFVDFELIICDNASTDDTEAICRRYASADRRVFYRRNARNIGAAPNFNLAVSLARGEYFKWAAHDDICHPCYLERCVAELDRHPDAVLVYPKAQVIDSEARPLEIFSEDLPIGEMDPFVRFKALTRGHRCYQVFGLHRLSVLRTTPLIGLYARGDEILLCWLALRGHFIRIDDTLFYPRRHNSQSMAMLGDPARNRSANFLAYSTWFDPRWRQRMIFPWWRSLKELVLCVTHSPISMVTRYRCLKHLLKWAYWHRRALSGDLILQARRIRARNLGAVHDTL